MLCQSCHQNTANTCIKTTVGNETKEYMLCSACAQKLGYVMNAGLIRCFSTKSVFSI